MHRKSYQVFKMVPRNSSCCRVELRIIYHVFPGLDLYSIGRAQHLVTPGQYLRWIVIHFKCETFPFCRETLPSSSSSRERKSRVFFFFFRVGHCFLQTVFHPPAPPWRLLPPLPVVQHASRTYQVHSTSTTVQ